MMPFRCSSYNAGRAFQAEGPAAAASRVSDYLARARWPGSFCYSLEMESWTEGMKSIDYRGTASSKIGRRTERPLKLGDFRFVIESLGPKPLTAADLRARGYRHGYGLQGVGPALYGWWKIGHVGDRYAGRTVADVAEALSGD